MDLWSLNKYVICSIWSKSQRFQIHTFSAARSAFNHFYILVLLLNILKRCLWAFLPLLFCSCNATVRPQGISCLKASLRTKLRTHPEYRSVIGSLYSAAPPASTGMCSVHLTYHCYYWEQKCILHCVYFSCHLCLISSVCKWPDWLLLWIISSLYRQMIDVSEHSLITAVCRWSVWTVWSVKCV